MIYKTKSQVLLARGLAARAMAKMVRFNYFADRAVASRLLAAKDFNPQAAAIHRSIADEYDRLASLADDG